MKLSAAGSASSGHPEQNPGVDQQKIVIRNKHGEKLVGVLHETGSTDIVILCHGFQSTKADDLHSVIQHFQEANRVTSAILGHSRGGNAVLLYASKYHDVHHVINMSGRYKTEGGVEERLGKGYMQRVKDDGFIEVKSRTGVVLFRVTEESLMDRLNTNMHEACLQIEKDCKVLTVHGSNDSIVRVEEALEFAKIIPNHKLHIIKGANHGFSKHQNELASIVLSFIKEPPNHNQDNETSR